MIGLLIVTHCDLGREFVNAAEFIVGRLDAVEVVPITQTSDSEEILKMLEEKINLPIGMAGVWKSGNASSPKRIKVTASGSVITALQ